jgi:hypothetical protein
LTIRGVTQPREARLRRPTHAAQTAQYSHTHYLLIGLVLGGLWILNRDKSLLFHAVQMLVVMSLFTGVQIVLRRRAGEVLPYTRLVVPKLVLVALAVGAEWLLASATSRSNAIVAVGLVVLVTALGPVLDRLAAKRATAASAPGPAPLLSQNRHERGGRHTQRPSAMSPAERTGENP